MHVMHQKSGIDPNFLNFDLASVAVAQVLCTLIGPMLLFLVRKVSYDINL